MKIVVSLPLPDRALNPHAKGHWRPKASATKAARQVAFFECKQAMEGRSFQKATYSVTFFCDAIKARVSNGYCPRDEANALASCKAYIDGCVDAGVIPDDSRKFLTVGGVKIHNSKESNKRAGVQIVFEEAG